MSIKGLVLDIDRFSTHDGPGIRTAVFLKGCPLSCEWCHSPESQGYYPELLYQKMRCKDCGRCVKSCPQNAISINTAEGGDVIAGVSIDRSLCVKCFTCAKTCFSRALRVGGIFYSVDEIIKLVKPDIPFYRNSGGGITISGGEPLMQPEFTYGVLSACHELGIHTAIETCGQGGFEELYRIAKVCDLIYYDVKTMDNKKHKLYTGLGNEVILSNLTHLSQDSNAAEKIIVRIPCISGINDTPGDIDATAKFIKGLGILRIELMPYNIMAGEKYNWVGIPYTLKGIEKRSDEYYKKLHKVVRDNGVECI